MTSSAKNNASLADYYRVVEKLSSCSLQHGPDYVKLQTIKAEYKSTKKLHTQQNPKNTTKSYNS